MNSINERLMQVEKRIAASCAKAGRDFGEVRIVAVSKGRTFDDMREAYDNGVRFFGENRLKEAEEKWPLMPAEAELHMVGSLQKNKVKKAVQMFETIHSLDDEDLAKKLNRHAEDQQKRLKVLLQVNISGETSKHGFSVNEASRAAERILDFKSLDLQGLMTLAPFTKNAEESRPVFKNLREIRDGMEKDMGLRLPELSMGMSQDFEVAIEEGATYIRLGTAIFG
ncbi:YggS family pyridoxal phosphate-dependent enzyme [Candidatus Micrarchaeota archaeon]|nr:YggS family pyridoxal phosphate-dependent enzyme [Candidatus Micrarchaeota archaeon]